MKKIFLALLGLACIAILAGNSNKKIEPEINEKNTKTIRKKSIVKNKSEHLFIIEQERRFGIIDEYENIIVPVKYNEIYPIGTNMFCVGIDKKKGLMTSKAELLTPLKYDDINFFSEGMAPVEINGKWGYINMNGKEVIVPKYQRYGCCSGASLDFENKKDVPVVFDDGIAKIKINAKGWGFIDKNGKEIISPQYDYAFDFSEGLAAVKRKGRWFFIDKNGKEVIMLPKKYDLVDYFEDGMARVITNCARTDYKYQEYKEPSKVGFIDKTGKEIIPLKYDYDCLADCYTCSSPRFSEDLINVAINNKWGFVDRKNKKIVAFKYCSANPFSEGLAVVSSKVEDNFGFIDRTGKEIIPLKYSSAESFYDGLAQVSLKDKVGYVDKTGKEIIPIVYDKVKYYDGIVQAKLNDKWSYMDKTGKQIMSKKYDNDDWDGDFSFDGNIALVKNNGKYGFINKEGKEVIPLIYDDVERGVFLPYVISETAKSMIAVKAGEKWGIIDETGKIIIPFKYDRVVTVQ